MNFYRTGTVTLTNASAAVVGVGTDFTAFVTPGECLQGPDGVLYEVLEVVGPLSLTLAVPFAGVTVAGASYCIVPTQSYVRSLMTQVVSLINSYSGAMANAFLLTVVDKAAPEAGDRFALKDISGGVGKWLTWANLKTALATWLGAGGGAINNLVISGALTTYGIQEDANGNVNVMGGGGVNDNSAWGAGVLVNNTVGTANTGMGNLALTVNVDGNNNTAAGNHALVSNVSGSWNSAFGQGALYSNLSHDNSGFGNGALSNLVSYYNCTGLGQGTQVTGNSQVQLGNSGTTTYVYGTVQNRSDARDKADIRDTTLGLDFVMSLRPVDYRWDIRSDYAPPPPAEEATPEVLAAYLEAVKPANLNHNGTKKRTRFHHGFIAQEVMAAAPSFGGVQDHSIGGGEEVMSLGYDELIAPLVKAVQELQARILVLEAK